MNVETSPGSGTGSGTAGGPSRKKRLMNFFFRRLGFRVFWGFFFIGTRDLSNGGQEKKPTAIETVVGFILALTF